MDIEKMGWYAMGVLGVFSLMIIGILGYSLIGMRSASMDSTTNHVQNLTKNLTYTVDLEISRGRQQLISVGIPLSRLW